MSLGGLDLIPALSGALYAPELKTLLVADLHLEKASSLARRGLRLPPYDSRATLRQLDDAIRAAQPRRLVFLGDSFHDGDGPARLDPGDLALLRGITACHDTVWLAGNHDPRLPPDLGGSLAEAAMLGPIRLCHQPGALDQTGFEIAGHLHPAAAIVQRGQRIRCKCFVGDCRRLVMPAFGSFTGGLSVTSTAFAGLFPDGVFEVWMLGPSAVHRFPGARVS